MKLILLILILLSVNIIMSIGSQVNLEECINLSLYFNRYLNVILPNCCESNDIICDANGKITTLKLNITTPLTLDFTDFPVLSSLQELVLDNINVKDGEFPYQLMSYQNLKKIHIIRSNIRAVKRIPKTCTIESLSLYKCELTDFPSDVLNCSNLKSLDLSNNDIRTIPEDISKFKDLEELILINSNLNSLPNSIYNLNLKKLYINANNHMDFKFYKFNNQIEECSLGNTNVSCYEPGACKKIIDNPEDMYGAKEINDDKIVHCESTRNNNNSSPSSPPPSSSHHPSHHSKSNNSLIFVIAGVTAILLVFCILFFVFLKKCRNSDEEVEELELKGKMSVKYHDILNEIKGSPLLSRRSKPSETITPFSSPEENSIDISIDRSNTDPSVNNNNNNSNNNNSNNKSTPSNKQADNSNETGPIEVPFPTLNSSEFPSGTARNNSESTHSSTLRNEIIIPEYDLSGNNK